MKHPLAKRTIAWLLALCLLAGMLPVPALAAESAAASGSKFGITLAEAGSCRFHHGGDIDSFDAGGADAGRGAYCESGSVSVGVWGDGLRVYAKERARFKSADVLLQPFTIDVSVPAYTSYTITYDVYAHVQRNSQGGAWCYLELFKGAGQGWDADGFLSLAYKTQNTAAVSNAYSVGRGSYSNRDGGTVKRAITLTFENTTGAAKTVNYPMAYYVGASRSSSALASYHHQTESYMEFYETSRIVTAYAAKAGGKYCSTLDDAADKFNRGAGSLTLLKDAAGNIELTESGTVDLGGHTLTGKITAAGDGAAVTVRNGTADNPSGEAILHTGSGELTLQNVTAKAAGAYNGVKNAAGTLTVDRTVQISPDLYAGGARVNFNGGGPVITNGGGAQIHLSTPLTLGSEPDSAYRLKLTGAAAVDTPVAVTTNVMGASPEDKFTDISGVRHCFAENGKVAARPYKVTFDANGGTVSPASTYVKGDKTAAAWPTPMKADCRFQGWFPSAESGSRRENADFTADTTLYAHWTARSVDVYFSAGPDATVGPGGAHTLAASVPYGKTYGEGTGLDGKLPVPTRPNYAFGGWYTGQNGTGALIAAGDACKTDAESQTLYAHWTRGQVTVSFDYDYGGAPAIPDRTVNAGDRLGALPFRSRTGYTLEGWYTERDGAGTEVTAATAATAPAVYYAHWTADLCKVTYDFNGGTGVDRDGQTIAESSTYIAYGGTYEEGNQAAALDYGLAKAGYALEGWYTKPVGGSKVEDSAVMDKIHYHTLYAHWTAKPCVILYNANGGRFAPTPGGEDDRVYGSDQKYGEPYRFPDPPKRDGHTFIGWFTAASDGVQVPAGAACGSESQELFAHWSVNHEHSLGGAGGSASFTHKLTAESLTGTDPSLDGVITRDNSYYTLASGSYYLDESITGLDRRIKIADGANVNLCLNGQTISASALNYCVLTVGYFGATLTLCDCQGGGAVKNETDHVNGGCLYINGVATLYGGTLTASRAYCATVGRPGRLTVDGAALISLGSDYYALNVETTANILSGRLEGPLGVEVESGGTLNVNGGSITGTEKNGVENAGTVVMTGGTVASTSTGFACHGIGNRTGASLTVTGGSVSGNGYGIRADSGFTLGGLPAIAGGETDYADIYLHSGAEITVGTGEQALAGVYSVKTAGSPAAGAPIPITTAGSGDYSSHFTSGNPQFAICGRGAGDNQTVQLYTPHIHKLCGADGSACAHTGEAHTDEAAWEPIAEWPSDIAAGRAYSWCLEGDVTAAACQRIDGGTTVNLCLNGHSLTLDAGDDLGCMFDVDGALHICDCKGGGKIETSKADTGSAVYSAVKINEGGVLNQYGGTVAANEEPVALLDGGTWNLYQGTLASTKTDGSAPKIVPWGRLNLLGGDGSIDMGGGSIEAANGEGGRTSPVRVAARPSAPYKVKTVVGSAYPIPISDSLPELDLSDCFQYTGGDTVKLAQADGQVALRCYVLDVKETQGGEAKLTMTANAQGRLTAEQLAEPWTKVGCAWDGYYDQADGGAKFGPDHVFTDGATLYPRWTECGHTHSGDDAGKTTVASTCTEKGTEAFICKTCKTSITRILELAPHTYANGNPWSADSDNHWHGCAVCGYRSGEAPHNWDEGVTEADAAQDIVTYTCATPGCGAVRTKTVPKYTYTFLTDAYSDPAGQVGQAPAVRAGTEITLPGTGVARTGYVLAGWAEVNPAVGDEDAPAEGTVLTPGAAYTMPAHPAVFRARWRIVSPFELADGQTMVLEDGTVIENTVGRTVTIIQPGARDESGAVIPGQTTVITLPDDAAVEITEGAGSGQGRVTVPAGSTVTVADRGGEQGPTVTVGGGNADGSGSEAGTADATGSVDAPVGSSVEFPGGNKVTITEGKGRIGSDGNITFPPNEDGAVTVTPGGGTPGGPVTVAGGGEGMNAETGTAPPVVEENDKVQIGGTTVTLPTDPVTGDTDPATGGVTQDPDGSVNVPAGSQAVLTDGSGGTTTVALDGQGGKVGENGEVTVPAGSTVTVTDRGGHEMSVTVPADGGGGTTDGTVKPDGGIRLPAEGSVTIENSDGTTTTITMPENGGAIERDESGRLLVPEGSVITSEGPGGVISATAPPGGAAITPGTNPIGKVELTPGGVVELLGGGTVAMGEDGAVTITAKDGAVTTVTPSGEGLFEADKATGEVSVISDGPVLVKTEDGKEITLSAGGVLSSDGKNATVEDGRSAVVSMERGAAATITAPAGGSFTVDPDVTVTRASAGTDISYRDGGGGILGAASTEGDNATYYTVQFLEETVGSGYLAVQAVKSGERAVAPGEPAVGSAALIGDQHYVFAQWNAGGTGYDFTAPVNGPVTLYAKWDGRPHQPAAVWSYDNAGHWQECTLDGCTHRENGGAHTYSGGVCTVCRYRNGGYAYPPVIEQPEHGDVAVSPARPEAGDEVTVTVMPEDGYRAGTVTVTDSGGKPVPVTRNEDGAYSFIQPESEVTVSVAMRPACPGDGACPIRAFTDASAAAWYHDGVHYCLENGLMVGLGNEKFGPNSTLTRGMLAQVLYNREGKPAVAGPSPFADVTEGAWYADAVIWAAENGIVSGYGNGGYGPNDPITREQLAAILWRYAGSPESAGSLDKFTDGAEASRYAVPALQWAAEWKIVSGKGSGILDPGGRATRAEVATMLMKYCETVR